LIFGALSLVAVAIGGTVYGWDSVPDVIPIPILIVVGLFLLGGRDSDAGAVVRRQVDERQAYQRLQVQALVGRALSIAVAIGYLVAVATRTTLWPWGSLLGVLTLTFVTGWWLYGEHGRAGEGIRGHGDASD
jgi:hypothetical protein